jgi:hypothetical protein
MASWFGGIPYVVTDDQTDAVLPRNSGSGQDNTYCDYHRRFNYEVPERPRHCGSIHLLQLPATRRTEGWWSACKPIKAIDPDEICLARGSEGPLWPPQWPKNPAITWWNLRNPPICFCNVFEGFHCYWCAWWVPDVQQLSSETFDGAPQSSSLVNSKHLLDLKVYPRDHGNFWTKYFTRNPCQWRRRTKISWWPHVTTARLRQTEPRTTREY